MVYFLCLCTESSAILLQLQTTYQLIINPTQKLQNTYLHTSPTAKLNIILAPKYLYCKKCIRKPAHFAAFSTFQPKQCKQLFALSLCQTKLLHLCLSLLISQSFHRLLNYFYYVMKHVIYIPAEMLLWVSCLTVNLQFPSREYFRYFNKLTKTFVTCFNFLIK